MVRVLCKCAVCRLTPCAADKGKRSVMRPAGSSSVQCPQLEGADWFWLSCREESLLSASDFILLFNSIQIFIMLYSSVILSLEYESNNLRENPQKQTACNDH